MASTTLKDRLTVPRLAAAQRRWAGWLARARWDFVGEWLVIAIAATLYSGPGLLDMDSRILQQSGEHNESATLPLLAEIGVRRYGEIPLWNPYMLTGFPHAGDIINHFWHPVSTLPILLWGGINGMKVSVYLAFILAGLGQWFFSHVFGARGPTRLWSALLFMTSGGLALLWRIGWYELLLGAAWFPWCFAALWLALQRRDRRLVALAAVCVFMLLSAGGGYYPLYLFGMSSVLLALSLALARPGQRWPQVRTAIAVGALSAGLLAVVMLPIIDGYRYTRRQTLPDREQRGSQPITYALLNYVIADPAWLNAGMLGTQNGYTWFYIGALPVAALALAPLALRDRSRRWQLLVPALLLLFILAWHANRYSLFRALYAALPILYTWRFPGRLLIVAASPLLLVAALALQYAFDRAREWAGTFSLSLAMQGRPARTVPLHWLADAALLLLLLVSLRSVFTVNKGLAFAPRPIDPKSYQALAWLKAHDPSLYYTNLGGANILWSWTPAAYDLEMPVINFKYNREVLTEARQRSPESPFFATPKYVLGPADQPPEGGQLLADFDGISLWHMPGALPFAFETSAAALASGALVDPASVLPLDARLDGPNRVVVRAGTAETGRQMVVLVSNYPGWQLRVDGRPAPLAVANDYLSAHLLPGQHVYEFVFSPWLHTVGLLISVATLGVITALLLTRERASP